VEKYCLVILPPSHRSAFCKFRCGAAPIRIETGRYENSREEDRKCPFCKTVIENEIHVMCNCPLYTDLRDKLFQKASNICNDFLNLSQNDKLQVIFTHPTLIRSCAKTCFKTTSTLFM